MSSEREIHAVERKNKRQANIEQGLPEKTILQSFKDEEMLNSLHREAILCNNISEFQHRLEVIRGAEA